MRENLVIQLEHVTKTFDGREILRHCSMHVRGGIIYGLLGPNGAGKTTLLKLMLGLLSPTSGQITVMGEKIPAARSQILRNVGSMIETPVFYEHLSAEENLRLHLAYMQAEMDPEKIDAALHAAGLEHTGDQPVRKFSLGMKQRLGIVRAMLQEPEILLLDEPFNGLDPVHMKQVRELLVTLAHRQNKTIVISSHSLHEMESICDQAGMLVGGQVCKEASLEEIKKEFPNGLEEYFFEVMKEEKRR